MSYSSSWEHQRAEWSQERRKLISAMSAPSGEFVNVPKESHVYINPPLKPNLLGLQENVYATKLAEYNRNVIRGGQKPNLIEEFATVAQEFKDTVRIPNVYLQKLKDSAVGVRTVNFISRKFLTCGKS